MMRFIFFFFFKQKTAYEITYGDWSSDVCSSDLVDGIRPHAVRTGPQRIAHLLPGRRTGGGDENRGAGGDVGIDAQGATQARGIAIGQRRVEDDGVRLRAARLLERIGSCEGLEDGVPGGAERALQLPGARAPLASVGQEHTRGQRGNVDGDGSRSRSRTLA